MLTVVLPVSLWQAAPFLQGKVEHGCSHAAVAAPTQWMQLLATMCTWIRIGGIHASRLSHARVWGSCQWQ